MIWREVRSTRDESEGFTLIELIVAMGVSMILLVMMASAMAVALRVNTGIVAVNRDNQQANIALGQIQHQVNTANLIFNPATEGTRAGTGTPPGFSVRILAVTSSGTTCDQWRVVTSNLETRSWPDGHAALASRWRTVIAGVVNSSTQPPFVLASTPSYGSRVLALDLSVHTGAPSTPSTKITTSLSSTDAQFFSPLDTQFCTPTPTPGAS